MKNKARLLIVLCTMICFLGNSYAISYNITFTGSGASTTVDSVVVQNLFKGIQVTVPGGTQLCLTDEESAISSLKTITDFVCVYPNPITNKATYSFMAKNDGNTQISVYGLDGRKKTGMDIYLLQRKQSFQLTLSKGVYLVQAKGNGFSYTTKIISLSMTDHQPLISYKGIVIDNKLQKVGAPEVKLQYNIGDQLLYKGYSGNYCTIVTDKPTETKTTDFEFVECKDGSGKHYAVTKIGSQIWMAENLAYLPVPASDPTIGLESEEDWLNKTSPYYYVYDLNKYGVLYNWYAALLAAPAGWHLPSDAEWTVLSDYLGGESIAGGKMKTTTDWNEPNTGATNLSGFSALPAGYRGLGVFNGFGEIAYWWSSSSFNFSPIHRDLFFNVENMQRWVAHLYWGFSVRCIKDNTNPLNIPTSLIPAGTFTMGSPETEISRNTDETQHQVTLNAFRMSQYEITNAQYADFLNAKGIGSDGLYAAGAYPTQALIYANSGSRDWGLHYTNNQWIPLAGYENNPVVRVTWYGATEYAIYAGGSLPTEAQWEYACRAGITTTFNTGSCLTNLQANYGWASPYNDCTNTVTTYPGKTQPVSSYAPNAWGLYDMHGNVGEWCSDWYGTYPTAAQTNPVGATTGSSRIIRGGSYWKSARNCRLADRYYRNPDVYDVDLGFRMVFVP